MSATSTYARARYAPPVLPRVAALREKAAELGYATSEDYTYIEKHTGEELYERPELSRLRADAKREPCAPFGLVLCYSVDRLARKAAFVGIILDECDRYGIQLQFVTEELEDTAEGQIILTMRGYAAQMESDRKRDRVQRATGTCPCR